jgi:competence/damage-inducible protein CinA-like protein
MSAEAARISVLTIGDELLSGEVADTNLGSIARELKELGLVVCRHYTVGDSIPEIAGAVRELSERSEALVVTGGLGPTSDDLTCEAVAKAVGRPLEFQPHLEKNLRRFFEAMGRPMAEENLKQAYLPEGSTEIPTAGGTAPGFMLEHSGALLAVLPGVPREMEDMLKSHVVPEFKRRFEGFGVSVTRRIMTFGAGESDVASLVADLIGKGTVRYGFLAMGGPVVVKLTASGETRQAARSLVDAEQELVSERMGPLMYAVDDEPMEEVVGGLLRGAGLTVAAAESITAGMVCSRMTNVPGSSDYFLGGVIAYSLDAKRDILGLPEGLLKDGAVSTDVVEAMAVSVRKMFSTDLGVATSGVAGPGTGGERKPPGTACLALAHDGGVISLERRLPGYRQMVRNITTLAALNMIRLHVLNLVAD